MFTGIITDIGSITQVADGDDAKTISVHTRFDMSKIDIGASIACSGVCLTVTVKDIHTNNVLFDISHETLEKTTAKSWEVGTKLNLEQAMKVGDEFGGHIVSGHVDTIGHIKTIEKAGDAWDIVVSYPSEIASYIAPKGSITVDGISLTVNDVGEDWLKLTIIPHTWDNTLFQYYEEGSEVNLEIDLFARYIARALEVKGL